MGGYLLNLNMAATMLEFELEETWGYIRLEEVTKTYFWPEKLDF
jgi:hypothetical protein